MLRECGASSGHRTSRVYWIARRRGRRHSPSEPDLIAALEREDLARLVRAGELEPEALDDLACSLDLHGVRLGELARADPQRIFEPDPHVTAHGGGHRGDRHLVAAGTEHGPMII